ncbi:hypothetical protein ACF09E_35555 [Streptomyces sp. NPDC014891]|uniref:hypothetical protein n=1 Tax=Streptomyces sp. NPDC014891 TaxID=3364929 RepID=UPI0036FC0E19
MAALMTVITAAASTYVAYSTYQNQQIEEGSKASQKMDQYVRRITLFASDTAPKWTLTNRNLDTVDSVEIIYWIAATEEGAKGGLYVKSLGIMPPCTVWTMDYKPWPKNTKLYGITAAFDTADGSWSTGASGNVDNGLQKFARSGGWMGGEGLIKIDDGLHPTAKKAEFCA